MDNFGVVHNGGERADSASSGRLSSNPLGRRREVLPLGSRQAAGRLAGQSTSPSHGNVTTPQITTDRSE
ncbi:hypothetical protein YT1_0048 [Rhodococcus ruber]|nr:hypothetical protein YT1_0048 [Rhodococcus ruber]